MYPHRSASGVRTTLLVLAAAYLTLVVYGSLVPLQYRYIPLDQAIARFRDIPWLELGIGSRADWVANLLLFIPLSFLWLGALWPRRPGVRFPLTLAIFLLAVMLSLGIEFIQLYFPQRTVSANDLLAESIGALVGVWAWWRWGVRLVDWVSGWREARGRTSTLEYLLSVYLGGMLVYNLLPLDLTISPVEIYHKWRGGGLNLIPFAYPVDSTVQFVYELATDVALWIPVSSLLVLSGRRTGIHAWNWTVTAALLLEAAQFFVFSRVSDVTDLITAMIGAGLGVWLARFYREEAKTVVALEAPGGTLARGSALLPLLAAAGWLVVLGVIYWYPFDFRADAAFLRERVPLLYQVPFRFYYYGTEFRAVTSLLHQVLFYLPLGIFLGLSRTGFNAGPGRILFVAAAWAAMAGVPFVIELGQTALPGKFPDTTDWLLGFVSAGVGFWGAQAVRRRLRRERAVTVV